MLALPICACAPQGVHITLRMRLLCEVCRAGEADPQQVQMFLNCPCRV